DQERAAQRHTRVFLQDAVGARHRLRQIGEQRIRQAASEAALFRLRVDPRLVHEFRIDGDPEDLAVALAELIRELRETQDFGRTHERVVERIKEQVDPAATERLERILFELALEVPVLIEVGRGFSDQSHRDFSPCAASAGQSWRTIARTPAAAKPVAAPRRPTPTAGWIRATPCLAGSWTAC